ncbi:MAG: TolC family protein [Caulobacterales bacterium]|nr:TolC family protein [Caulobacterales bacterium]
MIRPTTARCALALTAALGLAGCVAYAPAPPQVAAFPQAFDARRLDEAPAGTAWTGAELLKAALARNPRIAEARAKYAVALAAARTAKLIPGPTFTLTAEYASEHPHWGYGAGADLPLDYGARRSTRLGTADLQALQAWYDYGEAAWTVRTALAKAGVELDSAAHEIPLAERLVALRRERLARLEARVRAGEDARTVALTAQTELSAAEQRLAAARGRRAAALASLAQALGVSPAAVAEVRVEAPAGPAALSELPTWRRDAALSRRDVLRAVADYDLAENALRLEVAKQYPEVRIGPGYQYDHGVDKLPFNLSLVLPSYDLNRRAIDQAETARAAAGRTLEAVQADALAAVDTAAAALAAAQADRSRIADRAVPAAHEAAAAAARALRAGEGDRTDDLAARAAELDAELTLLDARRTQALAAADLEDALRRAFDPAETATLQAALTPPSAATIASGGPR